jgi:outer membrane protein
MLNKTFRLGLLAGLMVAGAQPALAASGDFLIRGRLLYVLPTDSSGLIQPDIGNLPSGVSVGSNMGFEIAATYLFTDNVGLEFGFAGSKLNFTGDAGTPAQGDIASANFFMPSATLQYYFMPKAAIRPYVGAGVNYISYAEGDPGTVLVFLMPKPVLIQPTANFESKFGYHVELGFDVPVNDRVFINFDVRYVGTKTTAKFVANSIYYVDVNVNPIIFGLGAGFRF